MTHHEPCYGLKGAAVKAKLARKEPITGVGLFFPDPLMAEVISHMPFDVILLDLEHGPWDTASILQVLSATSGSPAAIVARPGGTDQLQVQLLLDLGIDGFMIGHCDTMDAVRRAVDACKYPPIGRRGIGPTRSGAYLKNMPEYLRKANDSIMLWAQVEKPVPAPQLEQMLRTPGVDALMLGPCDIANDLGHLTDWEHPEVSKAIDDILSVARKIGIPFGVPGKILDDQLINLLTSDLESLQKGLELALDGWRTKRTNTGRSI
jgi:4-hydroxy-2-oxoheptanedioate aldolase